MDSSFSGAVLDPSKSSTMNMEEKRELVYELSKWSNGATEMLQSWSRQEILEILCAELGKERKYTGLTKLKIIEHLLKIVSEKNAQEHDTTLEPKHEYSPESTQQSFKRQRKNDNPSKLPIGSNSNSVVVNSNEGNMGNSIYCRNSACRANIRREDAFCKRCSCCICYQYDDNKDPSLWLCCSSEAPFLGQSCGLSCHLECAFRHEKSGIGNEGKQKVLDGSFYCVSCGKMNDLLGCWRKQLMIAKETRRVDVLCYRVSLSQKLLRGTKIYRNLYVTVEEAVQKLEAEVGPLTGLQMKSARGIVNRLSSGPEVQRLCALTLDSLDSMLTNTGSDPRAVNNHSSLMTPDAIKFEDDNTIKELGVSDIEVLTGGEQGEAPKILEVENSQSPTTNGSSLSNPSSVEDESNNVVILCNKTVSPNLNGQDLALPKPDALKLKNDREITDVNMINGSDEPNRVGVENSPITPCKLESFKDGIRKNTRSKRSLKDQDTKSEKGKEKKNEKHETGFDLNDRDFEHYVKVIRYLECEGHIEKNFRKKFLTWYSLRATAQEVRIVKVFVDTLIDDLESLAEQLIDAFSDLISGERTSVVPVGFCMKLWH